MDADGVAIQPFTEFIPTIVCRGAELAESVEGMWNGDVGCVLYA